MIVLSCVVIFASQPEIQGTYTIQYTDGCERDRKVKSLRLEYENQHLELIQSIFQLNLDFDIDLLKVSSTSNFYESFQVRFPHHLFVEFAKYLPIKHDFGTVDVENFYSKTTAGEIRSEEIEYDEYDEYESIPICSIFESFPKQDLSFEAFDSLSIQERSQVKLFTYESIQTGKRRFLLASVPLFYQNYFDIPIQNRHVYEIIRESFPCRLYFDLEYPTRFNPDIDGNDLTKEFINLVLWKIYEVYQLYLSWENVLVLDSTTNEKFSKHVIIHLKEEEGEFEYLFPDNSKIGEILQSLLEEMTEEVLIVNSTAPVMEEDTEAIEGSTIKPSQSVIRRPRIEFEHFWLQTDREEKQFLVDLGVYTRNRAFRLFGSCKYGKTKSLILAAHDKSFFQFNGGRPQDEKQEESLETKRNTLLNDSFIIPADIFLPFTSFEVDDDEEDEEGGCSDPIDDENELLAEDLNSPSYPTLMDLNMNITDELIDEEVEKDARHSAEEKKKTDKIFLKNFSDFWREFNHFKYRIISPHCGPRPPTNESSLGSFASLSGSSSSVAGVGGISFAALVPRGGQWKVGTLLRSHYPRQDSPFPSLDNYLLNNLVNRGGVQGNLQEWHVTKKFNGDFPIYKIRFQVGKNRFCENIGRSHKSNGIYLEVNLMNREVVQCCWDPDCRGFKSPPHLLPETSLPTPERVREIIEERILLES